MSASSLARATSNLRGQAVSRRLSKRSLTLSAVDGPTESPLSTTTLPAYFDREVLGHHSARPALICRQEKPRPFGGPVSPNLGREDCLAWDYSELDRHGEALARGLLNLGVKKGDRVGVLMGNNSAYASLQWACAKIGAILVTLNPAYRLPELVSTLDLVGVSHLFLVPRFRSSAYITSLAAAFPALANSTPGDIREPALPSLKHLVVVDNTSDPNDFAKEVDRARCLVDFRETLVWREDSTEKRQVQKLQEGLDAYDVINLQFTSGTTGAPKAVSLTHHNLLNNALSISAAMRISSSDVLCNVPPLFHCFGLVIGNLAFWARGASIVYASEAYDPRAVVDALVAERCTAVHGVPTHFLGVLSEVQRRRDAGEDIDLRPLRTGVAAGSPIPIDLMKQLIAKMNLSGLTVAYGMTEMSPVTFQSSTEDPIDKRVETVGTVQPHLRAKIVEKEGKVVPVNTPGEVVVAGYALHRGYWGDEKQTQQVLETDEEGTVWMKTGDEGVLDEDGYLKIVGRIKDIIIRGGENLFPVQIENILTAHTAIREAAVVAVPDPFFGEVPGAWIVREPGTTFTKEEARNFVAKGMNPQNAPGWVWFVGEDGAPPEIPKTASGKFMKHVLRDWSRDLAQKGIGRVVI